MSRRARSAVARIAAVALLALGFAWAPVATTLHAVEHFAAQSAPDGAPVPDGPCAQCVALAAFGAVHSSGPTALPALAPAPDLPDVFPGAPALPLALAFRGRAPPVA